MVKVCYEWLMHWTWPFTQKCIYIFFTKMLQWLRQFTQTHGFMNSSCVTCNDLRIECNKMHTFYWERLINHLLNVFLEQIMHFDVKRITCWFYKRFMHGIILQRLMHYMKQFIQACSFYEQLMHYMQQFVEEWFYKQLIFILLVFPEKRPFLFGFQPVTVTKMF